MGRLKLELYGKIIAVYVLAPKTYMVLYIDEKTKAVMMKIRCKGIPRIANDYAAFFKVPIGNKKRAERLFELQEKNKQRLDNEEDVPVEYVDIKERAYMFIDHKSGKKEILQRIPAQYFIKVAEGKMDLIVLFGSMLRKWKPQNLDEMYISPQYRHRQVGKTNWWDNGVFVGKKMNPSFVFFSTSSLNRASNPPTGSRNVGNGISSRSRDFRRRWIGSGKRVNQTCPCGKNKKSKRKNSKNIINKLKTPFKKWKRWKNKMWN